MTDIVHRFSQHAWLKRPQTRLALFILAGVLIWQFLLVPLWPSYVFPSPAGVLGALSKGLEDGAFVKAVVATLERMLIGFGAALFLGTLLGILLSQSKWAEDTIRPCVLAFQSLPSICWLPLAILWFGLNTKAILFVVVAGAIGSITMAIDSGIRHVPHLYINAARTMGSTQWGLYRDVIFPAALPTIVSGLRQGWSFAWRSLMAGELIFYTAGLGQLLQTARELNDINEMVAVIFLILIVGAVIETQVFARIEEDMRRKWGLKKR